MIHSFKSDLYRFLRWSEKYTKTDMVYLASSGFWINLGSVFVSAFSFFLYLAFAHFLPKDVYGTYQYLLSIGAIVGAFTLTGMNTSLVRAVAQGKEGTVRASIRMQLQWGLLPLLGAWAASGYYFFQGNILLSVGLLLIGIFVPLNNTLNSYSAFVNGRKDFRRGFYFSLFNGFLYYPALIVAAYFSSFALVLLATNLLSQAIGLLISYRMSLHVFQPNGAIDASAFTYGKHLSAMALFGSVVGQLDNVFVFHFLGAAPLALYSFATAIPDRIGNLTRFIPSAAFPKFAKHSGKELFQTLGRRILLAVVGSAILASIYMLVARFVFVLFFPSYMDAVPYSMLYVLVIIPSVSSVFLSALAAFGKTKFLYIFNTVIPILQLVSLFLGTLFFGLWGLIVARIVIAFIQFVLGGTLLYFSTRTLIARTS